MGGNPKKSVGSAACLLSTAKLFQGIGHTYVGFGEHQSEPPRKLIRKDASISENNENLFRSAGFP